jgi:hypothetical protein
MIRNSINWLLSGLAAVCLVVLLGLCTGCVTTGTTTTINADGTTTTTSNSVSSMLSQLPGVLTALGDVIATSPLDADTQTQIKSYLTAASTALAALETDGDADMLTQLLSAVTAVSDIVGASSADAATQTQVGNYIAWAKFAINIIKLFGAFA